MFVFVVFRVMDFCVSTWIDINCRFIGIFSGRKYRLKDKNEILTRFSAFELFILPRFVGFFEVILLNCKLYLEC